MNVSPKNVANDLNGDIKAYFMNSIIGLPMNEQEKSEIKKSEIEEPTSFQGYLHKHDYSRKYGKYF